MSIFSAEKNVREDIRSAVPEFFSKLDKLIKEILGVKTNVSRLKTTQQSRAEILEMTKTGLIEMFKTIPMKEQQTNNQILEQILQAQTPAQAWQAIKPVFHLTEQTHHQDN